MFSLNRFDPNQHSLQPPQQAFNPLARLSQRLDQAKLELNDQQQQQQNIPRNPSESSHTHSQSYPVTRLPAPRSETSATPLQDPGDEQKQHPISKKQKARIELGFTGPNSIPLPLQDAAAEKKPKTLAKQKYLKKKKERSKTRKQLLRKSNTVVKDEGACQTEQEQSKEEGHSQLKSPERTFQDPSTSTTKNIVDPEYPTSSSTDPQKIPKRVKRPKNLDSALEKITKKKIKTKHDTTPQDTQRDETEPEGITKDSKSDRQEAEQDPGLEEETMIIDQPGALPRFPAPTNPSIPDPRLLARLAMGLGYSQPSDSSSLELQDFIHFESQSVLKLDQIQRRPSNSSAHTALPPESNTSTPFSLSPHCVDRLSQQGFQSILAVQIAVLSMLMPSLKNYEKTPATNFYPIRNPPRDLCVNAPTGSGKTLSYIIPIIETLKSRLVCRIRAMIVLPTRDLVLQVKNTFDTFSSGTGLKAAILTGRHSFSREQALIGVTRDGLEGLVDVVIATPGRLLDHLSYTPGFSTDHLCFLVLDEADQLLNKNSHNWLHQILNPTRTNDGQDGTNNPNNPISSHHKLNSFKRSHGSFMDLFDEKQEEEFLNQEDDRFGNSIHDYSHHVLLKPCQQARWTRRSQSQPSWTLPVETFNPCRLRPFRILLFSATLRRDPTQVDHLGLRNPIFIKVSSTSLDLEGNDAGAKNQLVTKNVDDSLDDLNGFSLPATLKQHIIVTRTDLKPLVFIKLVMRRKIKRALCFCKSIEGADRLTSLCKLMFADQDSSNDTKGNDESNHRIENSELFKVECFSSDLSPAERSKLLKSFEQGQINILICSDMIARGIDIAQVENVINYDAPIDMKKYVHRVGRTARANQLGLAFTLVESQEAKFVKNFLKLGLGESCYDKLLVKLRFNWFDLQDLDPAYQIGLKKLAEKYGRSIDL